MTTSDPKAKVPTSLENPKKYSLKSQAVILGRALAKRTAMDVADAKRPHGSRLVFNGVHSQEATRLTATTQARGAEIHR